MNAHAWKILLYKFPSPESSENIVRQLPAHTLYRASSTEDIQRLFAEGLSLDLIFLYCLPSELDNSMVIAKDLTALGPERCGPIIAVGGVPGSASRLSDAYSAGILEWFDWPMAASVIRMRADVLLQLRGYQINMERMVRQRTAQIERTRDVTIEAIASLVEAKDRTSGRHIVRTREYLRALINGMRSQGVYGEHLGERTSDLIIRSAPLHDIGKIGVPDEILDAPRKHELHEKAIMERHPVIGGDALKTAAEKTAATAGEDPDEFLLIAQQIAYYHHENWDGTGYPEGLAGESIPLSARLMAFADTYDAARFKRQYKPAKSHAEVIDEMKRDSDRQFDPKIMTAFLAVADQFEAIAQKFADEVD